MSNKLEKGRVESKLCEQSTQDRLVFDAWLLIVLWVSRLESLLLLSRIHYKEKDPRPGFKFFMSSCLKWYVVIMAWPRLWFSVHCCCRVMVITNCQTIPAQELFIKSNYSAYLLWENIQLVAMQRRNCKLKLIIIRTCGRCNGKDELKR